MEIKPINPGQTFNTFSSGTLHQVQHKGDRVDIVDHVYHKTPEETHIVHTITPDGKIDSDY